MGRASEREKDRENKVGRDRRVIMKETDREKRAQRAFQDTCFMVYSCGEPCSSTCFQQTHIISQGELRRALGPLRE